MNLDDLSKPVTADVVNSAINKQFGTNLQITKLNIRESIQVMNRSNEVLEKLRLTDNYHTSHNNKEYMKTLMISEATFKHATALLESKGIKMKKSYTSALKIAAMGGELSEAQIKSLKVSTAMGQILESQEKAQMFMRKIVENKRALNEGTLENAQTSLAAQDIADRIQSMIEKFADIKYKELPALHDNIRSSQGVDAAETFNTTLTASLDELTSSLEAAKIEVNNAVAVLTGEEVSSEGDLDLDDIEGEDELDMDLDFDDEGDDMDFDMEIAPDEEEIDMGRAER